MLNTAMTGAADARRSQPDVRSGISHDIKDPSRRMSHPDMHKRLESRDESNYKQPLAHLARAPFSSISEGDWDDLPTPTDLAGRPRFDSIQEDDLVGLKDIKEQPCRAPIASLECMGDQESQSQGDHVSTRSESQALVSRQSSVAGNLKYKPLGKSGLRVSQIGLGTWVTFSPAVADETAEEIVTVAYDSGINLFDLSEAYSGGRAEVQLGKILKKKNWRRTSYTVITKIYWNSKPTERGEERGLSRKHIIESVKRSLERLQLDYIDVIVIHRADEMCPMEEVVRAASYCIQQGWCMYWGTSRWSPVEIMEAWSNCRQFNCITPIVEQAEYHLFCRGKTELYLPEMYNKIGVGTMAWSPLALGLITTKVDDGMPVFTRQSFKGYTWLKDKTSGEDARKQQNRLRQLAQLADSLNCTLTQLSVAWSLKNENLHCVLVGASTVEQLLENINALQVIPRLKPEHIAELEQILDNKPTRPPMVSTLTKRGLIALNLQ